MMEKEFKYELANVDMKEFYSNILCYYSRCPEIIAVKAIEDGSSIQRRLMDNGNSIFYIKHGENMFDILEEELRSETAQTVKCLQFEQHDFSDEDVLKWISIAITMSDILDVRCPNIVFTPFEDAGNASEQGMINLPGIKPYNPVELLVILAHEMRHEWQHANHPDWFKDYVYPESDEDLDNYLNHKTEIDAEAYARKLAKTIFDVDLFNAGERSLMEKLKKRASKIGLTVSDDDLDYLRDTLGS